MLKRACENALIHLKLKLQNYALVVRIQVFLIIFVLIIMALTCQLSQVANINVTDARTLDHHTMGKKMMHADRKSDSDSDLGLNPATTGDVIRVPMPALNEERRKELIKIVRTEAETARVSIRNVRRDANTELKEF